MKKRTISIALLSFLLGTTSYGSEQNEDTKQPMQLNQTSKNQYNRNNRGNKGNNKNNKRDSQEEEKVQPKDTQSNNQFGEEKQNPMREINQKFFNEPQVEGVRNNNNGNNIENVFDSSFFTANYNTIFVQPFSKKPIDIGLFQDKTLGAIWRFSSDESIIDNFWKKYIGNDKTIDIQTNQSYLRSFQRVVINCLDNFGNSSIATLLFLMNIARTSKIHFWTSNSISKEEQEQQKQKLSYSQNNKNIIQESLKTARKIVKRLCKTDIDNYIANINDDQVNKKDIDNKKTIISDDRKKLVKNLYIFAVLIKDIHDADFTLSYENLDKKFNEDQLEEDILHHFAPKKVGLLRQIQEHFYNIKEDMTAITNLKEELRRVVTEENLHGSVIFEKKG